MTSVRVGTTKDPKRIIAGEDTKIEFQCGLYIDPENGDIYAVNNDTVDTLVIFDRDAKGNTEPTRELKTPHGTYGIAVDEDANELFLRKWVLPSCHLHVDYATGKRTLKDSAYWYKDILSGNNDPLIEK